MATRTAPNTLPTWLPSAREGERSPRRRARPLPVAELHAGLAGTRSRFCTSPVSRNATRRPPRSRSFSPSNYLRQQRLRVRCRSAQPSAGSEECSIRNKLKDGGEAESPRIPQRAHSRSGADASLPARNGFFRFPSVVERRILVALVAHARRRTPHVLLC